MIQENDFLQELSLGPWNNGRPVASSWRRPIAPGGLKCTLWIPHSVQRRWSWCGGRPSTA